jgi:hypothetical protein
VEVCTLRGGRRVELAADEQLAVAGEALQPRRRVRVASGDFFCERAPAQPVHSTQASFLYLTAIPAQPNKPGTITRNIYLIRLKTYHEGCTRESKRIGLD